MVQRDRWLNLNGRWDFCANTEEFPGEWKPGEAWPSKKSKHITVPYPPGSQASGVSWSEPSSIVWYRCVFDVPDWTEPGLLLNIGASDYVTDVFINGHHVCCHIGGYSPIQCAIQDFVLDGDNQLIIQVTDTDSWQQPRGKQAGDTRWPIDYDPIVGIWQSVWLEPVQNNHVTSLFGQYSVAKQTLNLNLKLAKRHCGDVRVKLLDEGLVVATADGKFANRDEVLVSFEVDEPKLWSPQSPMLYGISVTVFDQEGDLCDRLTSYTGLREVRCDEGKMTLNGEPQYLKGVLDQGYFPGGWYAALHDDAYRQDIELTKAMGFNFARKHQKIEDPRYLYWADKLGLMLWAEMPAGRIFSAQLTQSLAEQWPQALIRDRGHPCIIGWVVFNESWGIWHQGERPAQRNLADALYYLTKSLDPTRPVIGNDGWEFSKGDIWAVHSYEQDEGGLAQCIDRLMDSPQSFVAEIGRPRKGALLGSDPRGLPLVLSECGGVGFVSAASGDIGEEPHFAYGDFATDDSEYLTVCSQMLHEIGEISQLDGFVWTQLTDVQQEVNGLLGFDRTPKAPIDQIKRLIDQVPYRSLAN